MPQHVHLLIWPRESRYSISQMLTSIKRPVSMNDLSHVRRWAPVFLSRMEDRQPGGQIHYRFWLRGGGYDRNLIEPKRSGPRSTTSTQTRFGGDSVKLRQCGRGQVLSNTNVPAAGCSASINPLCHARLKAEDMPTQSRLRRAQSSRGHGTQRRPRYCGASATWGGRNHGFFGISMRDVPSQAAAPHCAMRKNIYFCSGKKSWTALHGTRR
jgi:hypothetical protein